MKCLYYVAPTLVSTHDISDDLHAVGVDGFYVHVISRDEAGLKRQHVHSSNYLETLDVVLRVDCGEDRGPATKLLPTHERERDPDTRILVVDVDQVYPPRFVETLVLWSERLPDSTVCARGFAIPAGFDIANRNTHYGTRLAVPERIEIMQGSSGFLVRPRFFDARVFDYAGAPSEAFFVGRRHGDSPHADIGPNRFVHRVRCIRAAQGG